MGGRIGNRKDLDTLAFITAAGIVDRTQQYAITYLVYNLKVNNLWDKMKAIYPIVGGNSFSHKFNLKDPRDLDAAFRLTFNGVSHTNNGIFLTSGNTGSVNTFFNASTNFIIDNWHMSNYCITEGVNTQITDIAVSVGTVYMAVYQRFNNLAVFDSPADFNAGNLGRYTVSNTTAKGYYIGSRTASNSAILYKNGIPIINASGGRAAIPNGNVILLSTNGGQYFSDRTYTFFTMGDGLTSTDAVNLQNIVQQYQTTLGRQV